MEGAAYSIDPSTLEASAFAVLDDALAGACPDSAERASIKRFALGGSPSEVLIKESKNAELLVVGARGHGGFLNWSPIRGSFTGGAARSANSNLTIGEVQAVIVDLRP